MPPKYTKRCSTSVIIKKIQIKITMRFHLPPIRIATTKKPRKSDTGKDVEKVKSLYTVGRNVI